jgi:hypothetical protein
MSTATPNFYVDCLFFETCNPRTPQEFRVVSTRAQTSGPFASCKQAEAFAIGVAQQRDLARAEIREEAN